jgi:cell division septal protein FtsQ
VAGLILVAAAGWGISRSSVFAARSISVGGNVHLSRADVLRLGGVGPDTNLVWFSPGAVEERLEGSAWVLRATVDRALPSTLRIAVVERAAVAMVGGSDGVLIAADRTILGPAPRGSRLPAIDRTTAGKLSPGERLPGPTPSLAAVIALPDSLRTQIRRAGMDDRGILTMTLRSGAKVIYGDASKAEEKGLALQALLRWADRHDVVPATLDVRAPAQPALLPEGVSPQPTIVTLP